LVARSESTTLLAPGDLSDFGMQGHPKLLLGGEDLVDGQAERYVKRPSMTVAISTRISDRANHPDR